MIILNNHLNNGGSISANANKKINVTTALKTYTITCGNGGTGQTLKVTVNGYGTLTNSGSYTVPYGTTWTATLTADSTYTAGTISPAASGTVTGNVNVTCTAATLKKYTLTATQNANCSYLIKNSAGTTVLSVPKGTSTSSASLVYGTYTVHTDSINSGYTFSSFNIA